jgi:GDSL-like Lipase/Acylhydrolase family
VGHVVLLGDSIFDNGAYTRGGPDVVTQLRSLLPPDWSATLLAVDGDRISDVSRQLSRMPSDATDQVLSVGGNDALAHGDLLDRPARSSSEVLGLLADAADGFEQRYRAMIRLLLQRRLPLIICTIYNGSFPDPQFQRIASTGLRIFNDVIVRVGFELGLSIIDLRLVCTEPKDYANPIEPSSVGGKKIATAITRVLLGSKREPAVSSGTGEGR